MRFTLLDRIIDVQPGKRITAVKNLALAEEYLGDHFPLYPVMPGVLMVEAMTQACAWLIRATEDFAHSMVVLKEVRTIRYTDFVAPGESLVVTAEVLSHGPTDTKFRVEGAVGDNVKVSGRMVLTRYNLASSSAEGTAIDASVVRKLRQLYSLLCRAPHAPSAAGLASPPTS